jgi:hypothetical protein
MTEHGNELEENPFPPVIPVAADILLFTGAPIISPTDFAVYRYM